jgi:hypothetical protein
MVGEVLEASQKNFLLRENFSAMALFLGSEEAREIVDWVEQRNIHRLCYF